MISVCLIGSGNLGFHLFKAFDKSNKISLIQWFSRDIKSIRSFSDKVHLCDDLVALKTADIYVLAISDDAIPGLSEKLPFENRLVVHTSGSVGIHDLHQKHRGGVFYPLQSFSKEVELDFSQVPLCIEALDKQDFQQLKDMGEALGCTVYKINTEQRQSLHLAAVFVNNFVNQLYRIGHEITDIKNINFDILKPLILETAKKVQSVSPYMAQTGPAKRNDKKTIRRHLKMIDNELYRQIYEILTESIQHTHGRKKL